MTTYLLKEDDGGTMVIGPFRTKRQLDRFFEKFDRVFSSNVSVYTPTEYTKTFHVPSED